MGRKKFASRKQFYAKSLPKGGIGLEVGVQKGKNAVDLLEATGATLVYLVDAWRPIGIRPEWTAPLLKGWLDTAREQLQPYKDRVRFLRGLSQAILPTLPEASLDWAYVDANHKFAGCFPDLVNCDRLMKPTGVIAGHDFVRTDRPSSPTKAARKAMVNAAKQNWGVVEAVERFCEQHGWKLEFVADCGSPWFSYLLTRK